MLPKRFIESSCLKCHHQVTDVPQADEAPGRLRADRQVRLHRLPHDRRRGVVRPRPDRRAPGRPEPGARRLEGRPRTGSSSGSRTRTPSGPTRRMPRFYGVTNNNGPDDRPKNHAEIHAITHYLFAKSTPPAGFVDPPAKSDPERGKDLFLQKGCMACHSHRPYEPAERPARRPETRQPDYKPDAAATYDPSRLPRVGPRPTPRPTSARTSRTSPPSSSRTSRATSGWPTGSRRPRPTTPRA